MHPNPMRNHKQLVTEDSEEPEDTERNAKHSLFALFFELSEPTELCVSGR